MRSRKLVFMFFPKQTSYTLLYSPSPTPSCSTLPFFPTIFVRRVWSKVSSSCSSYVDQYSNQYRSFHSTVQWNFRLLKTNYVSHADDRRPAWTHIMLMLIICEFILTETKTKTVHTRAVNTYLKEVRIAFRIRIAEAVNRQREDCKIVRVQPLVVIL